MLHLIVILLFCTVFLLLYILLTVYQPTHGDIEMRLKALESGRQVRSDIDEELAKPFSKRILSPITKGLADTFKRFTPKSLCIIMEERMAMAGGFGKFNIDEFLLLCGFLAFSLPAVVGFVLVMAKVPTNKVVGMSMIAFVVGSLLPTLMLNKKIAARKLSIQKDLPDVLDLLTVSVEAGLGFDGALAKLTQKMKGVLVEECNRMLQEMRMGISRREALVALGKRCDVADLSLFTTALIQADQLGVSIGNVLKVQSVSMREKRKQRAEEQAMKAPIKMMFPLVLFIFPTIFIVILGPAIIQITKNFITK